MDISKKFKNFNEILQKEPFTRGGTNLAVLDNIPVEMGSKTEVEKPTIMGYTISQATYLKELDPNRHDILTDQNVPSIVAKVENGYIELKEKRICLADQRRIVAKQTQYLCGKDTKFTLCNHKPSQEEKDRFIEIKEEWINRNMEIRKAEFVKSQKSCGDSALVFYFNNGKIEAKNYSFIDGYTLIPHYDRFGKMDFFALYYLTKGDEKITAYDDENIYEFVRSGENNDWRLAMITTHGFEELPVAYIRGNVGWEDAQSIIDVREIIYNIYTVIMKRHGWGLLYIRGKIDPNLTKTAGAVILNDPNPDSNGTAEFKAPPTPEGMENLLKSLHKEIQIQSGTIFLHPEDVKLSAEPSGIAIKMLLLNAQEKAYEDAKFFDEAIDTMCRLFIYGLGLEKKEYTKYKSMKVRAQFDVWIPQSDTEIVTNLVQMRSQGIISQESASEVAPYGSADEVARVKAEEVEKRKREDEIASKVGVSTTKIKTKGVPNTTQENIINA